MSYFEEVKKEILRYKDLGEEKAENGALLVGRAPHIARLAWLHSIFPTLDERDIVALENELQTDIPGTYKQFLKNCSNGLTLFVDEFNLYGQHRRTPGKCQRQLFLYWKL